MFESEFGLAIHIQARGLVRRSKQIAQAEAEAALLRRQNVDQNPARIAFGRDDGASVRLAAHHHALRTGDARGYRAFKYMVRRRVVLFVLRIWFFCSSSPNRAFPPVGLHA